MKIIDRIFFIDVFIVICQFSVNLYQILKTKKKNKID
jgi:hypothetical protein